MATTTKYSRQREAILENLKSRTDHPTADTVYNSIREIIPNISLGTVYRNLNQLAESGTILKLSSDSKMEHYDANINPHCHFMCNCCGAVSDLDENFSLSDSLGSSSASDISKLLIDNFSATCHHKIDTVNIMFSGTCSNCLKSK